MKRKLVLVLALVAVLLSGSGMFARDACAACTTNTYFLPDGRIVICTTCCSGGNCLTNCF